MIASRAGASRTSINRLFGTVENLRDEALSELEYRRTDKRVKESTIDILRWLPAEIDGKMLHAHRIGARLVLWCHPRTGRGGRTFSICINRFVNKTIFLAAICLYAAEGTTYRGEEGKSVELVNSSPSLIRLMIRFLSELGIPKERVICRVELHEGHSIGAAESYWSAESGIPLKNFETNS